jgi:hypothetical protein
MDHDFIELYGTDAAQGMQVHPDRFWSCFSGPVGPDADAHRARLLKAYRTIPESMRSAFRERLLASETSLAMGAWAELEFCDFILCSEGKVEWEPTRSGAGLRSLDLVARMSGLRFHAEITHIRERPASDAAQALFRVISDAKVSEGFYQLTTGSGQPPVARLKARLARTQASGVLCASVDDWEIRKIDGPLSRSDEGESNLFTYVALRDRVIRSLKKKRRQARESFVDDVVFGIVIAHRYASTFWELIARRPSDLAALMGSNVGASKTSVHGVALGVVHSDRFPPVPCWNMVVPTLSTFQPSAALNTLRLESHEGAHAVDDCLNAIEENAIYYASSTIMPAPGGGCLRVFELSEI